MKPIVKSRIAFAIAFVALIAALSFAGFQLTDGWRWSIWGVATGVLFVVVHTAASWTSFGPNVRPFIAAIVFAYTGYAAFRALPSSELWPFVGGCVAGFLLTFYFVPVLPAPMRMPQRRARIAPLEESSPHTMTLPRDHTDKPRPGGGP
jgi:hypothetical protein